MQADSALSATNRLLAATVAANTLSNITQRQNQLDQFIGDDQSLLQQIRYVELTQIITPAKASKVTAGGKQRLARRRDRARSARRHRAGTTVICSGSDATQGDVMAERALVTGGAGFIGSHVVDSLVRDGYEVLVVDDLSAGDASRLRRAAHALRRVDITDSAGARLRPSTSSGPGRLPPRGAGQRDRVGGRSRP